jgi:hypothetical protein
MILKTMKSERIKTYLPKKLVELLSSKTVSLIILLNEVGLLYVFMVMGEIIYYLYTYQIPVELGDICDAVNSSK